MSHTRRRALTPSCLPAGDQQFCGPQSRQAGAVAPRRALWRLLRLGACRASRALDADSASKCALRRRLRTCALVSRWSEAQVNAGTRVAHARAFLQSHVHAQATRSSQCPDAVSQSQLAQSSVPCATAGMAVSLASRMFVGAQCSRTTSLQAASSRSFPVRSSAVMMLASTASGVVCALTLRTETSRHKSAHAAVLASVAERPRWFTHKTAVGDILGRHAYDAEEHEETEELWSVLDEFP